jgi:hypothetical protein
MPLATEQAKTTAAIHKVRFIGDSPYICVSGVSQSPDSADRNSASITAMLRKASSSGTGTSPSPRTARENKSP